MVSASIFRVLPLPGDAVEVEDHGDRGDVDRDVEGVAGSAHALGLLDLVIGQGGIGAGPCGGAGQEGGNASAGTRRVVGDLGIRLVPWKPAIQASTAVCWEEAPAPEKLPDTASVVLVSVLAEESVLEAVLSPQAATEASITMPDTAAMERTRMELRIILFPLSTF